MFSVHFELFQLLLYSVSDCFADLHLTVITNTHMIHMLCASKCTVNTEATSIYNALLQPS